MQKIDRDAGRIYVVSEIGINHNGSVEKACQMVRVSASLGCDAVKFQKRTVDVVYTKEELERPRESVYGKTNGDLKRGLELSKEEYAEIWRVAAEEGIEAYASPWDIKSLEFLVELGVPYIKIASPCITDKDLLRAAAKTKIPLLVSTGMSDLQMIIRAVNFIETLGGQIACLYHCTSTYPCLPEELNLLGIRTLRKHFPEIPIGYSGHEPNVPPTIMAMALGAVSVERHFTLNRTDWGSDQAASLEPEGMRRIVSAARFWEKAKGNGIINIFEREKPIITKLRRNSTL